MNWLLFSILAYVAMQLIIGFVVTKRIKNESDYLVGGRSLGLGIATMTIFATWFGAETCIGASGAIYEEGLAGGRADPLGYSLCIFGMGIFFAALFWRKGLTTIADLFRFRFGGASEKIAVLLMVPTSLLWGAAQIRAFGQILAASSEMEVEFAIAVAATIVILYTMMGGILADAFTDLVQGIVLVVGLIVTAIVIFANEEARGALSTAFEPGRLNLVAPGETFLDTAESWAVPVFGSIFAQELVSRTLAARSPKIARIACIQAGTLYLFIGFIPVIIGLAGPALLPNLEHSEQLLPRVAQTYLPSALYILFAGALVSAFLSTVNSNLLACAALTSHNFVAPLVGKRDEKFLLWLTRVLVVAFGLLAYVMARHAERVYSLVEEASAFGSSGLFVVIVLGLITRRGGRITACATLITGVVSYVFFNYVYEMSFPFVLSLVASTVCYLGLMNFENFEAPAEPLASKA